MRYYFIFFSFLVAGVTPIYSQNIESVRNELLSQVDPYHISIGMEGGFFQNSVVGVQLSWGMGSYQRLYGIDCGLRYRFYNPFNSALGQRITMHTMPLFISSELRAIRTRSFCLFLGAEMAYNFSLFSYYCFQETGKTIQDKNIGHNHLSASVKIGMRTEHFELSVFYEYDMQPMFNQKYLFESSEYDYQLLRSTIRERDRCGIRITYLFII